MLIIFSVCQAGTYLDGIGDLAQCKECPSGSNTDGTGAIELTQCCKCHSILYLTRPNNLYIFNINFIPNHTRSILVTPTSYKS